jgi:hypothetical protein
MAFFSIQLCNFMVNLIQFHKKFYICILIKGVPHNNGLRSNPLNLIRVMPA